jgi:hypothetical protein
LPERGRMEVQPVLMSKSPKINVDRTATAIEARKPRVLLAFDIPKLIAYVLDIEDDALLFEPRSFSAPIAGQVTVREETLALPPACPVRQGSPLSLPASTREC